jgi:hypothetical protein
MTVIFQHDDETYIFTVNGTVFTIPDLDRSAQVQVQVQRVQSLIDCVPETQYSVDERGWSFMIEIKSDGIVSFTIRTEAHILNPECPYFRPIVEVTAPHSECVDAFKALLQQTS